MQERTIPLEGTCNLRDFGGYPADGGAVVKRGLLFRSDSLSKLPARAFERFSTLGIRTLIDLRTKRERLYRPYRFPPDPNRRAIHLPIPPEPELDKRWTNIEKTWFMLSGGMKKTDRAFTSAMYRRLPARAEPALAVLFPLLLDPGAYPVLIHCTAGRDRTGFAAAMILRALGVPAETAIEDYCLIEDGARRAREGLVRSMRALSLFQMSREAIVEFLTPQAEYLRAAFESIEAEHGSVESYLERRLGFSGADRGALRALLLTEARCTTPG